MFARHYRLTSIELSCNCLVVACWVHDLCPENWSGLLHDHGYVVKDWIARWKSDIPWSRVKALDLADVVPQCSPKMCEILIDFAYWREGQ